MPTVDQFIVWIVVGLLGGSLAGRLITWERKGFGRVRNLALGLAGALIGGLLFRLFGLFPALDKVAISLRDVVAAVLGSLLVLIALRVWRRSKASRRIVAMSSSVSRRSSASTSRGIRTSSTKARARCCALMPSPK